MPSIILNLLTKTTLKLKTPRGILVNIPCVSAGLANRRRPSKLIARGADNVSFHTFIRTLQLLDYVGLGANLLKNPLMEFKKKSLGSFKQIFSGPGATISRSMFCTAHSLGRYIFSIEINSSTTCLLRHSW